MIRAAICKLLGHKWNDPIGAIDLNGNPYRIECARCKSRKVDRCMMCDKAGGVCIAHLIFLPEKVVTVVYREVER